MSKDAAVTVRLPIALKRRLELRARAHHRSASAQMVHDLDAMLSVEPAVAPSVVPVLGRFAGSALPSEAHIQEVRQRLWSRLRTHG
jgi:plasmid stability protein